MNGILYKAIVCMLLLLCLAWFGQVYFYRDPGSIFFDRERAYETRYSTQRKAEAQQTIDFYSQNHTTPQVNIQKNNRSLCVGLSSVRRQTQYLATTIGSLLHGLTDQERAELHISVLIAQTDPTRHPNWNEQWLRQAADRVFTYELNTTQLAYLRRLEESEHFTEKGVFDYVYALRQCYDTGASYIGMFEDDIILAHGWLIRTLQGLSEIPGSSRKPPSWLFMRLFNQERSIGWASRAIGGNNEHWIILGIGLGISAPVLFARQRWRGTRRYLDLGTLFVVVSILVPGLVILFFQSGKASLLPHSPGVFNEPFGCCSQAMIFPRSQVPLLTLALEERKEGQIDLMLDEIALSHSFERYALYPVQAQHIGIVSARKTVKEEAQAIWSMAFEDLKPKELEREHRQMVNEYQLWSNQYP